MWSEFLTLLRCPRCQGVLAFPTAPAADLNCSSCGSSYRQQDGMPILIPDTAPIDRTDLAFETQWELHARGAFEKDTIYGESAAAELTSFLTRFAIETPAALAGKRILDVGCGSGRLTRNLAVYAPAACIVGGDRSGVARFAHRQCRELRNALVVQFDLHAPPFGAETFDFIYADGVLPHVPDPAAALRRLDRLLRPGGRLFVWMYPRGFSPYRFVRDLLLRSCRYPPAVQQALCWMFGVPLHAAFKLYEPLRGPRRRSLREVVFMLHDNLTPEFQHRRTPGELAADFALLGYTTRALDPPVGIVGTKPGEHQAAPD